MRAVSPAVTSAIENNELYRVIPRLTIYKSRIFFENVDLTNNSPDFAHPVSETGHFIAEAIGYVETLFVTIAVDGQNRIWLMRNNSSVAVMPELLGSPLLSTPGSRPGIWGNYLFWQDADNSDQWSRIELDEAALTANSAACVSNKTVVGAGPATAQPGAIYPIAADNAFICWIKNGALAATLWLGSTNYVDCPSRFINPVYVYDAGVPDDVYKTHFAGASRTTHGDYFYLSYYDGSVRGVRYSNGMFSDIFTSIPSDLSVSSIGNVFSFNDVVYMCLRFERKEEFASATRYNMLSYSRDGITFTMDQRILVTLEDYRFLAAFDGTDQMIFSATNRHYVTEPHYQIVGEAAPSVVTAMNSLPGSSSGWNAELVSGAEEYFDSPYIDEGAFAKIEIGVHNTDGMTYVKYHDVVVASIKKSWVDGDRQMNLQLVPDGMWHTSVMTHPFYMEIQGRQGVYDPAKELNNLYKFSGDNGVKWSLSADLWLGGEAALPNYEHVAGTTTDHWSQDLKTFLEEYPVLDNSATFEMRLYGWSRAGKHDTNPNTADTTPTSTNNDDFYGIVEVEDTNGNVSTVVTTTGELASTYKHPIQTYFDANIRPGSEPVIYNLTNPGEGKKIKRIGIRVISGSGHTTYYPERVEFPGISAVFTQQSVVDEQPWQMVDVVANWPLVDTRILTITTGNATAGDEIEMAYTPKAGHLYAIAVVGDVSFRRSAIDYIQDAHFEAHVPVSSVPYAAPTWERSYPPGTGPAANAAVKVKFSDWPYYATAILTKDDIVKEASPRDDHAYLLHWADSRMEDSDVSASYIPYFFSDGTKIKVQLYLAGAGSISNIVDGQFKVYFFESPEMIDEGDFYGGSTDPGTSAPFEVINPPGTWADPYFTPGVDYYQLNAQNSLVVGNDGPAYSNSLEIKNNTLDTGTYYIRMKFVAAGNGTAPPGMIGISQQWGGAAAESNGIPYNGSGTFEYAKTITLGPGQSANLAQVANVTGGWMASEHREWYIVIAGEPSSNQVPSMGRFSVTIPVVNTTLGENEIGPHIATAKKGVPQIAFSTRPYSAFNFEIQSRFHLVGPYSQGGLIGLAADEKNFIVGYIRPGYAGIARVRNGVRENIDEQPVDEVEENKMMDARFWHRDGRFGLEVKRSQDTWPRRGSQFLHDWNGDTDGAITAEDDIYHVGVYALIDPPKFRTVGHRMTSKNIAAMPLDWNPDEGASGISTMPTAGQVDVGGRIYNYTGKNTVVTTPRGPFHLRNRGPWPSNYNADRLGYVYPNTDSIEFLMFRWWDGTGHATDYANALIGSNEGYAWANDKTLWRVWITTSGSLVWLRNRSRWYSDEIPSYYNTDAEKIWITQGLTGVSPVVADEFDYHHPEGCFAFLHSDDSVAIHGFVGFSGDPDNSVMDLLERFCRVAGTEADAAGDVRIANVELDDNEEVSLE